jgi:hypothetical protein
MDGGESVNECILNLIYSIEVAQLKKQKNANRIMHDHSMNLKRVYTFTKIRK